MSTYSIRRVFDEFAAQLALAADFRGAIYAAHSTGGSPLHELHVRYAVEKSFVLTYMAWENFLEGTFLRYMCGASDCASNSPALLTNVRPLPRATLQDAFDDLRGGSRYITWLNTPDDVLGWARNCFDQGEPYVSAIGPISDLLNKSKVVRNRAVHRSDDTIAKYRAVVLSLFSTKNARGIPPGRLLRKPLPVAINSDLPP